MNLEYLYKIEPYSLEKNKKSELILTYLNNLTLYHYSNCWQYKKILDSLDFNVELLNNIHEIPFLPVRLFKMFDLLSITKKEVIKTMTSSGTSGQDVSKIYLDKETSLNQSKALIKIVSDFTGLQRLPMLVIDTESVLKDRNLFSARGAGILGFSIFASKRVFALDENMSLNIDDIMAFLDHNKGQKILLFGFTFMIYKYFIQALENNKIEFDLSNAILIHGGGWKKLINQAVSANEFKEKLSNLCGINTVHDYYGMVEQTGSIYMECEYGNLHTSIFSDIIIRKAYDFSQSPIGEKGIIQTISLLPSSYPGHSLLTEDEGVLLGEDDCLCGRLGKYFKILGRIKDSEIRGCSDTYAE